MGSRKYIGLSGPRTLVTFFKVCLCNINAVLLCATLTVLLVTGSQVTYAQNTAYQKLKAALPQNHRLPLSGGLRDSNRAETSASSTIRRTIPTLRARYRPQDGDLFGEGQADSDSSAGGSIFDQLEKGPQPPATKRPTQKNPFGEPSSQNPFGEPKKRKPFDPSPREPLMDTQREAPALDQRPEKRIPRQSGSDGVPRLPEGSEFTPDSGSIPEMPMPDGGKRSTEKAGTVPPEEEDFPSLVSPNEEETPRESLEDEYNRFNEDVDNLDLIDPSDRSPRSSSSRRRRSEQDRASRNKGSNVYRPAREPSYYSSPAETYGQYAPGYYGTTTPRTGPIDPRMEAYRDTYGQYPPGYNPTRPRASQPYAASPAAMQAIVQDAVQHAMRNYAANPANPAVAPYGYDYTCPPCPPSQLRTPPPEWVAANCNCGPTGSLDLRQQFTQPSSSRTSADLANDVYEGVVSGDQEIESYDPQCFPQKRSGFSLGGLTVGSGGLGVGGVRNNGPGVYYGSLFGGWTGLDDLMLSGDEGQIQLNNDSGFNVGFAIGQIQGKNLRSEIEVTYRSNDLDGMTLNDLGGATQFLEGDGTIESISGMLNVFWDFTDVRTRMKPYLGFGFGGVSADADFQIDGDRTLGDGNDTSLAYQWIGGISYETRRFSDLFVEYRYFAADSLHFNTTLPASAIIDGDGELEYRTSSVVFGVRMKF